MLQSGKGLRYKAKKRFKDTKKHTLEPLVWGLKTGNKWEELDQFRKKSDLRWL